MSFGLREEPMNADRDVRADGFAPALLEKVASLPPEPGVYLFKNATGQVIYVGKAKNLRVRVRSYFQTLHPDQYKTAFMVRRIAVLDYIVTRNEKEAFLLENTLIKKHRPRYNVRLRDDKDYVSLRLDLNEAWPRLEIVRRPEDKNVLLFGPYASAGAVRETLQSLQRIFPLRTCTAGKFTQYQRRGRPCLEYQLRRCAGPCCDLISVEEYTSLVRGVVMFLRGRKTDLVAGLAREMQAAAEKEEFEKAARIRDQIRAIQQTLTKQWVTRFGGVDTQVVGFYREGEMVSLVVLDIEQGRLIGKAEYFFPDLPEDDEVIVSDFLSQFYLEATKTGEADGQTQAIRNIPREVLIPHEIPGQEVLVEMLSDAAGHAVVILSPQRGARADLLETARVNAAEALRKRKAQEDLAELPLRTLQQKLHLPRLPRLIECFDISNTMGTGAVGSMVVFRDGRPDRAAYRRFRIKTVTQADDFAMLGEVLRRRLTRAKADGGLPDLLIVDGGKGQLAAATQVVKALGIEGLALAGLAKARVQDDELYAKTVTRSEERLFLPNRKNPVILAKNSSALHLVVQIRDEAHRFAITYHRNLRRKGVRSMLADIPGVGVKRQRLLLRHFGSVRVLKEANINAIAAVEGMTRAAAERVYAFFHGTLRPTNDE